MFSWKVIVTFLPQFFSFSWCWPLWARAADPPVRQREANVTVKTQWHSPLPRVPVSYIKRGGFLYTVRWLQTLCVQIPGGDNVSISCWGLTLNLWATVRVTDLYTSSLRVSSVKKRRVTFHLLTHLSALGDPVPGGPWASGGSEGPERGRAQIRLVLLAADCLQAGRSQCVRARACDSDVGGDGDDGYGDGAVAPEPLLCFSQKPKMHSYRSLHLPGSWKSSFHNSFCSKQS